MSLTTSSSWLEYAKGFPQEHLMSAVQLLLILVTNHARRKACIEPEWERIGVPRRNSPRDPEKQRSNIRGSRLQSFEACFWLDRTDLGSILPLPFCSNRDQDVEIRPAAEQSMKYESTKLTDSMNG
jgi:hypothetical protein